MTNILAFAGKKKAGKNALCNFLHGYHLKSFNIIDGFEITDKGKLIIDTLVTDEKGETKQGKGMIDVTRTDIDFAMWAMDNLWPFVKHYAFATPLKEIAMGLFNIPRENLFGTDEQKNAISQYNWEDMPTKVKGKSGPMTYREFMQYFGTNICRKIYSEVWTRRAIADIKAEEPLYAMISDARFPNEIEAVQKVGGKVIKLTGGVDTDSHDSEIALDNYDGYDAVIDTKNQTIQESCQSVLEIMDSWGWLAKEIIIPKPETAKINRESFTNIK